ARDRNQPRYISSGLGRYPYLAGSHDSCSRAIAATIGSTCTTSSGVAGRTVIAIELTRNPKRTIDADFTRTYGGSCGQEKTSARTRQEAGRSSRRRGEAPATTS